MEEKKRKNLHSFEFLYRQIWQEKNARAGPEFFDNVFINPDICKISICEKKICTRKKIRKIKDRCHISPLPSHNSHLFNGHLPLSRGWSLWRGSTIYNSEFTVSTICLQSRLTMLKPALRKTCLTGPDRLIISLMQRGVLPKCFLIKYMV